MENEMRLELKNDKVQSLKFYAELLKKDMNTMIDEALERYFKEEQERLTAKERSETTFDYDEFWSDIDLED
jgi:hypothetical protein